MDSVIQVSGVQTKGHSLSATCIALTVFFTIILGLRFWSRFTLPSLRFWWDDWTALASWPFTAGTMVLTTYNSHVGFGRHVHDVESHHLRQILQNTWISYITYDFGIALIRLSALLFYKRVFGKSNRIFVINFWAATAANIAWLVALIVMCFFICDPLHAFWDQALPGFTNFKCLDVQDTQLSSGVTSVFLDVWLLLIPLPLLWNLKAPMTRKLLLIAVFLIGYCVVVFTVGRMISIFIAGKALDEDITWAFVTPAYWYILEIAVASISISLPSLFQLVKRAKAYGFRSLFNNIDYSGRRSSSRPDLYDSRTPDDNQKSSERNLIRLDSVSIGSHPV